MEYGGISMKPNQIRRVVDTVVGMSAVKRFHGRSTIHTQSIADHSCRVAMLSYFIALEYYDGDINKANYLSTCGLFHDFSESLLQCDVAAPLKGKFGIGTELRKLEESVVDSVFDTQHLKDLVLENAGTEDFNIMKLSDVLDFGLYVREEISLGNSNMLCLVDIFSKEMIKYPDKLLSLDFVHKCIDKILG